MSTPPRRAALLGLLALACAAGGGREAEAPPHFPGQVARVRVAFAVDAPERAAPRAARTAAVVRQSARDWLEHRGRLDRAGPLSLAVTLEAPRLRTPLTTWLLAWAAPPDRLAARVVVSRDGRPVGEYPMRVESALAGFAWRDPEARLERLARRLGRRLAEGL